MERTEEKFILLVKLIKKYFKETNLYLSEERLFVLKLLYFENNYLNVTEIENNLKIKFNKKISRATIYKTLKIFKNFHLLKIIILNKKEKKFKITFKNEHNQFICLRCKKIENFFDIKLKELKKCVLKKNNFILLDENITIYGFCKDCQKILNDNDF